MNTPDEDALKRVEIAIAECLSEGDVAMLSDRRFRMKCYLAAHAATHVMDDDWKLIETVPEGIKKDGIGVLGFFPNLEPGYHDTYWIERHQLWASRDFPVQPTHWRYLPEPPK